MKKIISIIVCIVLTVSVFTAASASTSSTYAGLMSPVQAEKRADVGKNSAQKATKREVPWAKENAEEQLIHEEDARNIQKENAPKTIAWVDMPEKELREIVIKDAMKRYKNVSYNFYSSNVDKAVVILQLGCAAFEIRAQVTKIIFEKWLGFFWKIYIKHPWDKIPPVLRELIGRHIILPIWIFAKYLFKINKSLALGYNALIESKLHFNYKIDG